MEKLQDVVLLLSRVAPISVPIQSIFTSIGTCEKCSKTQNRYVPEGTSSWGRTVTPATRMSQAAAVAGLLLSADSCLIDCTAFRARGQRIGHLTMRGGAEEQLRVGIGVLKHF